jgi:hypothetical protein
MSLELLGDWKMFERLIAAIHAAKMSGSAVSLNERIDQREFDVVVRFKNGLHDYLTLIECKCYKIKVPVEKVEAFVTKSRSAKANKALMFSTNGFQSGCHEVAKSHGVDLYTVAEKIEVPESWLSGETMPGLNIAKVYLNLSGVKQYIPSFGGRLEYLLKHSVVSRGAEKVTLDEFIQGRINELEAKQETLEEKYFEIPSPPLTRVTVPGYWEHEIVSGIGVFYQLVDMVEMKENAPPIDAHQIEAFCLKYELMNEVTGENESIMAIGLHLGFDTSLEAGRYYVHPLLSNTYYVESIDGSKAKIYVLECYTRGHRAQVIAIQDVKYQSQYVAISDDTEIKRLEKLYLKMKREQK